jgi:hypothetical protein
MNFYLVAVQGSSGIVVSDKNIFIQIGCDDVGFTGLFHINRSGNKVFRDKIHHLFLVKLELTAVQLNDGFFFAQVFEDDFYQFFAGFITHTKL